MYTPRVMTTLLQVYPSRPERVSLFVCCQRMYLMIPIQCCHFEMSKVDTSFISNYDDLHDVHGLVPLKYLCHRLSRNLFFDIAYNVVTSEHTILNDNVSICGFSDDLELTLLYSSRDASTAFCQSTVKEKPEPLTIDRTTA